MSHNEHDVDPCLGCTVRGAIKEWWGRVLATNNSEMIENLGPEYVLVTLSAFLVDIIIDTTAPGREEEALGVLFASMRIDLANEIGERAMVRAEHAAPETIQ